MRRPSSHIGLLCVVIYEVRTIFAPLKRINIQSIALTPAGVVKSWRNSQSREKTPWLPNPLSTSPDTDYFTEHTTAHKSWIFRKNWAIHAGVHIPQFCTKFQFQGPTGYPCTEEREIWRGLVDPSTSNFQPIGATRPLCGLKTSKRTSE